MIETRTLKKTGVPHVTGYIEQLAEFANKNRLNNEKA